MESLLKFQEMQDEMTRFEAEISEPALGRMAAFRTIQQRVDQAIPQYQHPHLAPMMFAPLPQPPPPSQPPSLLVVPQQVQRPSAYPIHMGFPSCREFQPMQLQYHGMPEPHPHPMNQPALISPPQPALLSPPQPALLSPPQPIVLSAKPIFYTKPMDEAKKAKQERKRKRKAQLKAAKAAALTPVPLMRPVQLLPPAPPPPTHELVFKSKKDRRNRKCGTGPKYLNTGFRMEVPTTQLYVSRVHFCVEAKAVGGYLYTSTKTGFTMHVEKLNSRHNMVRTAGGKVWEDSTLLEWAEDDYRMFCGDLGNDVTDELLTRTFSKYPSLAHAKVVRDKRTNKSKGFGFLSFKDPGDFIKAMKEMNGRYVGSRPIKLRKSTWKRRSLDAVRMREKEKLAQIPLHMSKPRNVCTYGLVADCF